MLNKTRTSIAVFSLGVALATGASAGNNLTNMNAFFNEIGGYGNAQGAQAFKGQTRDYYTGGSAKLVVPKKTYQLVTMTPPSFGAGGCGDIDIQLGSFSFINSDQFVAMLKNIGNNAKGAIFSLALESISPQLNAVQKYMKSLSDRVNQMNIDSCEMARGVLQADDNEMMQKATEMAAHKYTTVTSGMADDWQMAKDLWNEKPADHPADAAAATKANPASTEADKANLIGFNILEKALNHIKDDAGADIPADDKKVIRAIFGTTISRPTDVNGKTEMGSHTFAPQSPKEIVDKFLAETTTEVSTYTCKNYTHKGTTYSVADGYCLDFNRITITFDSLSKVIQDKVLSMRNKVMTKDVNGFTTEEKTLLGMSRIPIMSLIKQEYMAGDHNILGSSLDLIATEYLAGLMTRAGYMIRVAIAESKKTQSQKVALALKSYEKSVNETIKHIHKAIKDKQHEFQIMESTIEFLVKKAERARQKTAERLSNASKTIIKK